MPWRPPIPVVSYFGYAQGTGGLSGSLEAAVRCAAMVAASPGASSRALQCSKHSYAWFGACCLGSAGGLLSLFQLHYHSGACLLLLHAGCCCMKQSNCLCLVGHLQGMGPRAPVNMQGPAAGWWR
jgi:hypothetical protein